MSTKQILAKKIFTYDNISIFLSFSIITIFSLILVNQFVLNDSNSRSFNNYFGTDCRVIRIDSTSDTFKLDPQKIEGNFSFACTPDATFAKKHYGYNSIRAFYGEGDYPIPPMLEGSFFSEDQLLSEERLCVLGSIAADRSCYEENGELYYTLEGYTYRVIGICGEKRASDLDICVFLNWGGYFGSTDEYSEEYILDGVSTADIDEAFFSLIEMMNTVQEEDHGVSCNTVKYEPLIRVIDPVTQMIYWFSGASILFLTMLTAFFFVIKREKQIAIKKLIGFSAGHITFELTGYFVAVSCLGYLFGLAILSILNTTESFSQSDIGYFATITPLSVVLSLAIIILLAIIISVIPVMKTFKSDTSSAHRQ